MVVFQCMMEEIEHDEECVICLEQNGSNKIALSDYFGCNCKQLVHINCIEEWSKQTMLQEASYCIICRHRKEESNRLFMIGRAVLATYGPEIEILSRTRHRRELEVRCCSMSCSCLAACCFCFTTILLLLILIPLLFVTT